MSQADRAVGDGVSRVILASASAVQGRAAELNQLDGVAGDGDLGITMGKASLALARTLGDAGGDAAQVLRKCGAALAAAVPSTSGTLLAMGFLAAAKAIAGGPGSATAQVAEGFAAATREIQLRGKASPGDKTMLDVLAPVTQCLQEAAHDDHPLAVALHEAAARAVEATEATRGLIARAGRAKWMQDRGQGHPDAGCQMLSIAIAAAADAVAADGGQPEVALE